MKGVTSGARGLSLALFTMFWTAQTVSLFGDRLSDFSLAALINMFAPDPSLALSKLYLAMFLPVFMLAPLIGALVDRLHKGWTLVVADLVRGILVCCIPFVFERTGSFYPVFAVVFAMSTLNLFFLPAKSGIIPSWCRSTSSSG